MLKRADKARLGIIDEGTTTSLYCESYCGHIKVYDNRITIIANHVISHDKYHFIDITLSYHVTS